MTFQRFGLLALVALALLQGSCQSREGRLRDRIELPSGRCVTQVSLSSSKIARSTSVP